MFRERRGRLVILCCAWALGAGCARQPPPSTPQAPTAPVPTEDAAKSGSPTVASAPEGLSSRPATRSPAATRLSQGPQPRREWAVTFSQRVSLEQIGTDTSLALGPRTDSETSSQLAAAIGLTDGRVLWSQRLDAQAAYASCTDGRRVYRFEGGEASRRLVTRDLRTGQLLWHVKVPPLSRGLACGIDAVLTVDDYPARFLQAWDPESGRELWNADCLPKPGRRHCFPIAVANGLAYLHCYGNPRGGSSADDLGQFLLVVEARTGRVMAEGLFNQSESAMYNSGRLEWSERQGLLFGDDTSWYEYGPSLRAVTREARLVWSQQDLGHFALLGDTLVCEAWHTGRRSNYSRRTGLAGVAAATGKELWRQKGPTEDDAILGTWRGHAVVSGPRGNPAAPKRRHRLAGLEASGKAAWSVEFAPGSGFSNVGDARLAGERLLILWSPTAPKAPPVLESYLLPR